MDPTEAEVLRAVVIDSVRQVFGGCGLPLKEPTSGARTPEPERIVAFIGFSGPMSGTLTLMIPVDLVQRTVDLILQTSVGSEQEVLDWSGELANMLLGRVKVALSARRVEVKSDTPQVMRAGQAMERLAAASSICAMFFQVENTDFDVWFDAVCFAQHPLFTSDPPEDGSLPSGEVIFFD